MSAYEQDITVWSLVLAVLFYAVTIFFFLIADKCRLNLSLALQKLIWMLIILGIALPAYSGNRELMASSQTRSILFAALALATIWVLIEVFLANRGAIRDRVMQLVHPERSAH